MELQNDVRINRNHKDSSFRFIFHRKENALMLYNAINGSDYQNPDELEIYTMENFVYMVSKTIYLLPHRKSSMNTGENNLLLLQRGCDSFRVTASLQFIYALYFHSTRLYFNKYA